MGLGGRRSRGTRRPSASASRSGEPADAGAAGAPRDPAARYFAAFFLRAAQYAVIRSDTAFFSSAVI